MFWGRSYLACKRLAPTTGSVDSKPARRIRHSLPRRVLATAYTTVSPNSIVIGIDYEQSRLLLHQVKRDEVSTMTKRLGGQS